MDFYMSDAVCHNVFEIILIEIRFYSLQEWHNVYIYKISRFASYNVVYVNVYISTTYYYTSREGTYSLVFGVGWGVGFWLHIHSKILLPVVFSGVCVCVWFVVFFLLFPFKSARPPRAVERHSSMRGSNQNNFLLYNVYIWSGCNVHCVCRSRAIDCFLWWRHRITFSGVYSIWCVGVCAVWVVECVIIFHRIHATHSI